MAHLAQRLTASLAAVLIAAPAGLASTAASAAPAPAVPDTAPAAALAPDEAAVAARARQAERRLVVDCASCDAPLVLPVTPATARLPGEFDAPTRIAAEDPFLSSAWEHGKLATTDAWARGGDGRDVVVAVLDTGVAPVAELDGRLLAGWDTTTDQPLTTPSDPHGHGTMVAVTAAGAFDNGVGAAGAAHAARILPVRVMFSDGTGYASDLAEGIRWAVDQGADVLNLSVSGAALTAVEEAVAYARGKGVPVVAAMGNDAEKGNPVGYPAAYPDVIAVGAIDRDGLRANFSNYGSHVDVAAPGVGLTSMDRDGTVVGWSGTSAATPLVAAAVAGVYSATGFRGDDAADSDLVATWLAEAAVDAGAPGFDHEHGHGTVRMPDLIDLAQTDLDGGGAAPLAAPAPGAVDAWPTGARSRTLSHDIAGSLFDGRRATQAVLCRDDEVVDCLTVSGALTPTTALLLTAGGPTATLPDDVTAALSRILRPGGLVTIVGGTQAVSTSTFDRVRSLGYSTRRVSGPDRFSTAVAIRDTLRPGVDDVLLVRADDWADAITAGAYAADRAVPVLLTNTGSLPSVTADSLRGDNVIIVGGTAAVSGGVRRTVDAYASGTTRVSGPDRAATAAAVATRLWGRRTRGAADAWTFVDIYGTWHEPLAAAQLAAAHDAPELAVNGDGPTRATIDLLAGLGYTADSPAAGHAVGRATRHRTALRNLVAGAG